MTDLSYEVNDDFNPGIAAESELPLIVLDDCKTEATDSGKMNLITDV